MDKNTLKIDEFVYKANPNEWLEVSDEIYTSIELIIANEKSYFLKTDTWDGIPKIKKTSSRSIFLLSGFCLENLIKGILIYDDATLINTGKLVNKIKSHNLILLLENIKELNISEEETKWLRIISESIPDWGRYPTPLHFQNVKDEIIFSNEMFKHMSSIRIKLKQILIEKLKAGWNSRRLNVKLNVKILDYGE